MNGACSTITDLGVMRDVLAAVDCNTRNFARLGYEALAAPNSTFQTVLTLLLTIYVAVIGYRLLFASDGMRLSDGAIMALKVGAILALVTSWNVFQTLVFDVAARAPVEIATIVTAPLRGQESLAANPVAGLQFSFDQIQSTASRLQSAQMQDRPDQQSRVAGDTLALAANVLFAASAGLVAVITVAIAVLTATGPLFIILFLFFETRGLFVGWVRGIAAAALALLSSWTVIVLMLAALEPWLTALPLADAGLALTTATIIFVFAASQLALIIVEVIVASGLRFGSKRLVPTHSTSDSSPKPNQTAPQFQVSRPAYLAQRLQSDPLAWTARADVAASAVLQPARRDAVRHNPPRHLGDLYRRPVGPRHESSFLRAPT